ncbi:hypothetical protein KIPB_014009, partial [Kipferlia bialata]
WRIDQRQGGVECTLMLPGLGGSDLLRVGVDSDGSYKLLQTPFVQNYVNESRVYLGKLHSFPAFLGTILLDVFNKASYQ